MNIIAHRGDHTNAPENTMPAFAAALNAGIYGIEFDVRLTADKVPVVFHYFSLIGTSASGLICNHTHTQIQDMRVLSKTGEPIAEIPTSRDVIERFGGELYLEIHVQDVSPEAVSVVGNLLRDYPSIWHQMEVTSREPAVLRGLQKMCPGIATDLLLPPAQDWMTLEIISHIAADKARLANARAVHLHPTQLSADGLAFIRSQGMDVHCWDVNDLETFDVLKSFGIQQFSTDHIHRFMDMI